MINESNNIYDIRFLPYVSSKKYIKNGKECRNEIENLSSEEIRNMSCEPRMLWLNDKGIYYPAELPLSVRGFGTGVRYFLCYIYKELTEEEKAKYFDRTIIIKSITEDVVQVYGENSKTLFGKTKKKLK